GEEYFEYFLKPKLKPHGVAQLRQWMAKNGNVVLLSQGLEQIIRPLANHLGVPELLANRLEFRDALATGRLLDPVVSPRSGFASLARAVQKSGALQQRKVLHELRVERNPELAENAIVPAKRPSPHSKAPLVLFQTEQPHRLSVHHALAGRQILLI